ncbi:MarR family transcriptional regulator [Curtobacterium sp. BRD11]|uniref:MarR family winged helix-turn-helix transcriptional regulator n=1 Tax=Curtobacterium sp. BRD11 TaxID=2962581 RepID=UPI0028817002|nr:MarR family transcriptional regulator [Curtobacterium sp. BRD11]MDT0210084.1 MarR family transcriptional regulator [Curtobacterium sp. BRD11]
MAEDVRWLSDDERESWLQFAAVLQLLPAALDLQLTTDERLTHFDYFTLAMLSEAQGRKLRTSRLAAHTFATLPRLSRVLDRLEKAGFVERTPCPEDRRATDVNLTEVGWQKVVDAAPGHVNAVRHFALDALTQEEVAQLGKIAAAMLTRLDPERRIILGFPESSRRLR